MRIRLPGGTEIPIREVAELEISEGYPTITRIDRQRVINIQADADKEVADFAAINAALYGAGGKDQSLLEEIRERYPGVDLVKGGEAKDWDEARASLLGGVVLVVFCIYALLAIPFRSYLQPLIVMAVVPFGIAGAILGHLLTFQTLSLLSMLGIIALSGVVVNDSLVMVDYINHRRKHGHPRMEAVRQAGMVRFRPILLTSLTTFAGLIPILLERSLQAQFMIPMATSLGFGVLFATFITLLMVPCIYLIMEDCVHLAGRRVAHTRRTFSG
jgi:multidrug efflux pump subunit AcrB